MKALFIKKLGLAILGMLVMGYSFAVEPEIKIVNEKKFTLKIRSVSENIHLQIKDSKGMDVYSEVIEKSDKSYSKLFDLSTLPDGNYFVELEGSFKIESYTISMVYNKIASADIMKTETFKPTLVERGTKVYVSKFNPDNSYLNVTIFNSNDRVVYEETLKGKVDLGRIYDFSKVKGEFKISMSSGDKTYTQLVSID